MKKIIYIFTLLLLSKLSFAQTTYFWVGGVGPTSYTANSNWNTMLDGTGADRGSSAATDILIFDGTNVGGVTPTTGQVSTIVSGTNCAQLIFRNNANVILGRSSTGSGVITINGDPTSATDFVVNAGCIVTLGGSVYNYDVQTVVGAGATALISGTVYLSPLSTSIHTRSYITAQAANNVVFASGANCYVSDSSATSGFNGSVQDGVTFQSGSSLYYYTGRSPIGSSSTVQFTNFEPGSNLYIMQSNVRYDGGAAYSSSSWTNRKTLANVFVRNNSIFNMDGYSNKIDNLTIDINCTYNLHTSGQSPILGNLVVNGTLTAPSGSSNSIIMGGNVPQTISGTGTISIPNFTVANYSDVTLARSLTILTSADVNGKLNFGTTNQITGSSDFTARVGGSAASVTANTTAGSYQLTNVSGTLTGFTGLAAAGNGLASNTNATGFSNSNGIILLSKPATSTVTGATYTFFSDTATLTTANVNGFDSTNGSVIVVDNKSYQSGVNYVFNGATSKPFGISSGSTATTINSGSVTINANVLVNRSLNIYNNLAINAKLTLNPGDLLHIFAPGRITGSFSNTNYIVADYTAAGVQSKIQYDGLASASMIPLGTVANYLPVMLTPTSASDFSIAAFTGITTNGMITGTPFTAIQKERVVNAVWNVERLTGTGNVAMQLGWPTILEGSSFTALTNDKIGMIKNNGTSWNSPIGTGDNTLNIVMATVSSFGSFGAGAVPQSNPFVFNPIPAKTYGQPDFSGGATSLNTDKPIIYTSSNPAVATIVSNLIHIVGAGTSEITAMQETDGFYPAASEMQTLTVNKAPLTIKADRKTKFEQTPNPVLTATYTGFVLGETTTALTTQATLSTTATAASLPGAYLISVNGATAANYTITHVNDSLIVLPKTTQTITFNILPTKTYGNAAFSAGATSTNSTIPITYASSNPAVATVAGNTITITGAGTSTITASQIGNDGFFPAANKTQVLTVNKANLTIRIADTTKITKEVNPGFRIVYTGFVYSQTPTNLLTPVVISTVADINTAPGVYDLIASGATSNNYNIIYQVGKFTILPTTGTSVNYMSAFRNGSGNITIKVFATEVLLGDIVIYDMMGRPMARKNLLMPKGFVSTEILARNLPSGNYIVTIRGNKVDFKQIISFVK